MDKVLSHPRINLTNSQTLTLDDVETGILLSDFVQQLRPKKAVVSDIYFSLLENPGKSPILIPN